MPPDLTADIEFRHQHYSVERFYQVPHGLNFVFKDFHNIVSPDIMELIGA